MRYLLILAIAVGSGYLYKSYLGSGGNIGSYQSLITQVATRDVAVEDVKTGVHQLANLQCQNMGLQLNFGFSESACVEQYQRKKETCEVDVFTTSLQVFTDKKGIVAIAQRFIACVGIGQVSQLDPLFESR